VSSALAQLQEFSISSIRDVTGVSVEMLGLADREQAASLEYQRRQSAMTILASLFNGLRHYRKLQGRTLLEQLKLLPPGVLVRILVDPEVEKAKFAAAVEQWKQAAQMAAQQGQMPPPPPQPSPELLMLGETEEPTKVQMPFDPAKFGLGPDARFDVIVDETPSSPNQKEATWAALQPFMDKLPPTAIKKALQYSPLPETAATEIGDAIEEAGGGQQQIPPELQQAIEEGKQRIAELEQENAQLKDKSQIDAAKVGVQQQDADTRRLKVESDDRLGNIEAHLSALSTALQHLTQANGQMEG
jgi:hypothetical protein